MRVILSIDALHLPLTGIGWYTLELVQGLRAHPRIEELVFTDGRRYPMQLPAFADSVEQSTNTDAEAQPARTRHDVLRPLYRLAGELLSLRCRTQLGALDDFLCHTPNYIVPRRRPVSKNIATIHDLSVLRYPQLHPRERVRYMSRQMPVSIAHCGRLIVSSQSVAQEVAEAFLVPLELIDVIPLGVRGVFSSTVQPLDAALLSSLGVERDGYLLFVNGADPRKDLRSALSAFEQYRRARSLTDFKLLITVPPHGASELNDRLADCDGVTAVPYPDEGSLAALYRGAAGLLYPSTYEGFGLPVVESLASGRPVLVSQADTLQEFVGLPGVLSVDTADSASFSAAIDELCSSSVSDAAQAGAQAVADQFSWGRCVNAVVDSYARLA